MKKLLRRTRAIAFKELLHMRRDARVLYLSLGMPVVMLVVFGFAVSLDVDHLPLAVADGDRTSASWRLAEAMVAGGAFVRVADLPGAEDAAPLFRQGRVKAVLVIPAGFRRALERGERPGAQLLVDGSDGAVASIAVGLAAGLAQEVSLEARSYRGPSLASGPAVRTRFNPGLRSSFNIVPGVIVMILGMVSTLLTALTISREWERGNMEQLFATPVSRSAVILGKLLPYLGLGLLQTALILGMGRLLFDVPLAGSLGLLFFVSLLFLLCMLGIGMWVSVANKSQLASVQIATMLGYMPAMMLSGFLFPIANMPLPLRALSTAFPARYYLTALRGVMLKGNGPGALWVELVTLAGFAALVLTLAIRQFRRRLD